MPESPTTQPLARPTRALRLRAQWDALGASALRATAISLLACLANSALAQSSTEHSAETATKAQSETLTEATTESNPTPDHQASFTLTAGTHESAQEITTSPAPPMTLILDEPSLDDAETRRANAWMLDTWTPSKATEPTTELAAHFALNTNDSQPLFNSQAERWTRSVYSQDAEQLTSLTPGKEMFSWELTDDITLAGVGTRRLFTDRSRAFVVSAEAGFDLSPHAGLMVGYELLQTSSTGALPDNPGGDALFARFQLRF